MARKIERFDPEFCPDELGTLYDFLSDKCELPEDEEHWILTKREFTELSAYSDEDYYDPTSEDDVEKIAHFANMIERIKDLKDNDVLEINFDNAA